VKFKLDENLPVSSAAILTSSGHDVDTVTEEALGGAPDRDVVAAATAAGRILVSLDRGLGDIRAYPPGGSYQSLAAVACFATSPNSR
jgi:predicted nuclease of predicted toxin-antitoxin system